MKYTLFLFLLCGLFAQAQTVTKSYVLGTDGTTYFEVTTTTQEDESATTTKVRIGPAASLASDQADKIESKSRDLAGNAFAVSRTNLRLNEIGAVDAEILALTTVSPLKSIQARYASSFTAPGWTIDKGSGMALYRLLSQLMGQTIYDTQLRVRQQRLIRSTVTSLHFQATHPPEQTRIFILLKTEKTISVCQIVQA